VKELGESTQEELIFKDIIKEYFKRVQILTTQVPSDLRRLLLPPYMLYSGFKGRLYIDSTGRLGFEIIREKASRPSIKTVSAKKRVEQEIFGVLGHENMFRISGKEVKLVNLILTCRDFVERYEHELPKGASVLIFSKPGIIGPFEIEKNAEIKIIHCGIYWIKGKRRYVKYIPFAWIFGNTNLLEKIDPLTHAESDFYSSLFGKLYEIAMPGYKKFLDEHVHLKVFEFYRELIKKVRREFKEKLFITQADEYVFQRLLERYKFFLCPGALFIETQPILQEEVRRKPDFHIQMDNNRHIYVEIEPPFYKPFIGSRPSSRLRDAINQVLEWKEILIRKGVKESVSFMIIIGLLDDLSEEEKKALQTFNETRKDLIIVTWDWIIENINKVENEIISRLSREKTSHHHAK